MKSEADVVQLLLKLPPSSIADWLRLSGWSRLDERDDARSHWVLGDGPDATIALLPMDRSFRDYELRITQLARDVQVAFNRSWDELIIDLISTDADLLSVQSQQTTPPDGSISFSGGLELLTGVKDLLRAAAKATAEKRPFFGPRQPGIAERYVASLRLGQTHEGSYVFNVLASIGRSADEDEEAATADVLPVSADLARTVTRTLVKALQAAQSAAEQYRSAPDFRPFMESVSEGVSAELCDSVLALMSPPEQTAVRIGVRWARRRPLPDLHDPVVTFTRDDISPLAAASARFKSSERISGARVTGVIRQMRREEIVEGTPFVVTLHVLNAPVEARAIRVRLEWQHFHTATAAFDSGRPVTVVGDLERDGNFYWLYNPSSVLVGSGPSSSTLEGQGTLDDE